MPSPLSNKTYNIIKWLITIFLPAVGALYFALAQIFDFSRITGVNGTINAVIAFLGVLIGYSSKQYAKTENVPDGDLIVNEVDGDKYLSLGVNKSVEALTGQDTVKLNVVDHSNTDPRMQLPE